ncbi:MAG: sodium:proton antiporter [Planctomycetes bacterium]|nr:sodium:proton antiporter [Planctomycetota bacterium]
MEPKLAESGLLALAIIIVAGSAAQWIAWIIRLPSILLLLLAGLALGPGLGWVNPDEIFGNLLLPFVSIAVALILFEGGLSLNRRELKGVGVVVTLLVTVGVAITGVLLAGAAYWVLGLELRLAALLGAILTVTGPTVVLPLLAYIKPRGRVASVLKWEGILVDPIGVLIAVLVFEAVTTVEHGELGRQVAIAIGKTIVIGGGLGAVVAWGLAILLRRNWVPDQLEPAVALMLVVAAFVGANHIQAESGLMAVTVMGIVLANQRRADVHRITEFKEHLRVFLISAVFIVLSARLRREDIFALRWEAFAFFGISAFLVRPLAVAASTIGSGMSSAERAFMGFMAPRGIVAAAVTSVFAITLEGLGVEQARLLPPVVFITIICSVLLYGLLGGPFARLLKLADRDPQGMLVVGANPLARQIAKLLGGMNIRTVLIDANRELIETARMQGLETLHANVVSGDISDVIELHGIGRLIALTPNDEVNMLAMQRFARNFGQAGVYRLPPKKAEKGRAAPGDVRLHRLLFEADASYSRISELLAKGAVVRATKLSDEFDYGAYRSHNSGFIPLLIVSGKNKVSVVTADAAPEPGAGDTVVSLAMPT